MKLQGNKQKILLNKTDRMFIFADTNYSPTTPKTLIIKYYNYHNTII